MALRQAKAAAYAINADQAMWLIDHEANRIDYERDFDRRARLILGVDPVDEAGLTQLQTQFSEGAPAASPPILAGLLGTSFAAASQTDPGRTPIAAAIASFLDFLQIDGRLRGLENKNNHRDALELRTGTKPGQALFAFARMDKALDAAIVVADAGFEQRLSSAGGLTLWLERITATVLGLCLLLAAGGLWQRYREYR